jgi:glycosyltransferase involved in cell wall biosynthesis
MSPAVSAPVSAPVSVIMAAWNRPQFLAPAIASVLAQRDVDLELLVVDDGSDAPTRQLLRAVDHPAARVLWLEHCGSPAAVRNAGVTASRGRYVAFMDSDDLWRPDKLRRQLDSLGVRPACRWGYTAVEHVDAQGVPVKPAGIVSWRMHAGPTREAVACLRAHCALPTVIVERELLLEVGGFDESLPLFEDYDLWLRLALRSEADAVAEPLVQLRRHDQHYSGHDACLEAQCRVRFLDRAWAAFEPHGRPAELRRLRALARARLARWCAAQGKHLEARRSLRRSLWDGLRHPGWWRDALATFATRSAG